MLLINQSQLLIYFLLTKRMFYLPLTLLPLMRIEDVPVDEFDLLKKIELLV